MSYTDVQNEQDLFKLAELTLPAVDAFYFTVPVNCNLRKVEAVNAAGDAAVQLRRGTTVLATATCTVADTPVSVDVAAANQPAGGNEILNLNVTVNGGTLAGSHVAVWAARRY